MKPRTLLTISFGALAALSAVAQEGDPLSRHLVPPHLIMEKAEEIGLSEEQRRAVQEAAERAHQQVLEKQAPLERAVQALSAELAKDKIDAAAAKARLNEVLEAERAMKQLHLALLVGANNALTLAQKKALQQMRQTAHAKEAPDMEALEKRLKRKLQRVQEGLQAKLEAGEQPLEIPELMQRFPELMREGKHRAAERVLDQALRLLNGKEQDPEPNPSSRQAEAPEPPIVRQSLDQLESEIDAMRVEEVAWRKIAWRTCLLDGLRESHLEKKPLLLWVFIDRPVDDKRC